MYPLTTDTVLMQGIAMRSALAVPDSQWYLLRLANLSTLLREWIALHLMSTLACADALLGQPVRVLHLGCHHSVLNNGLQFAPMQHFRRPVKFDQQCCSSIGLAYNSICVGFESNSSSSLKQPHKQYKL